MFKRYASWLPLLCLVLLIGAGSCQRKGIPCPKPTSKRNRVKMTDQAGHGLEAIKVPIGKNGRVKKRKKLLFLK